MWFPLTNNCGGDDDDDEAPQSPTLQKQGDDVDSDFASGFTWKVFLMGYGFGTIFGLLMGLLVFSIGKPKWFVRITEGNQHKKSNRRNKSNQRGHVRRS